MLLLVQSDRELAEQLSGAEQEFLLNLARAKDNITIAGEAEVLAQLERDYNEYLVRFAQFTQLPRTDRRRVLPTIGRT